MRIAFVITRADAVGGAQVHVRDLAAALWREGHEAKVFVGGTGPATEALAAMGIPYASLRHLVHPISPLRDFKAVWELTRALRAFAPDLVSTHSSKAGLIGRVAAKLAGAPALFTAHGWAFTEGVDRRNRLLYTLVERIAARFAARIITVSEYDRSLAISSGVGSPEKLVAVHNGMPDVSPDLRADPAKQPPQVVMVARFESQKDHRTLLLALSRLTHLPWSAEFIGSGPLMEPMKQLASELGVLERVTFAGDSRAVAGRLAQAQVFALISHYEGLPRSIIEAMRAGLPVIASDVGGVAEEVAEGETGFLVPRAGDAVLQERLAQLLADPELRAKMGRAARERYDDHFTFHRMFTETFLIYKAIV